MSIRKEVNKFINKKFEDYNLYDVVELSKLKLQVGQLAMKAKATAQSKDSGYRLLRSKSYRKEKLLKCTDKMATEVAYELTEEYRIESEKAKAEADLQTAYHKDLNDIVIAVRMCARIYDNALNDKLDH